MALAHGRALSYVSRGIGPISPGRWQTWQFFWRIGRTSLLKVTPPDAVLPARADVAISTPAMPYRMKTILTRRLENRSEDNLQGQLDLPR
jgi:hypothetical protein